MKPSSPGSELRTALSTLRQFFNRAVMFSVFVNVLVLAPTLYMLQVYGRVVNSRSTETLLMLTVLIIGIYMVMEFIDWVRNKLVHAADCGSTVSSATGSSTPPSRHDCATCPWASRRSPICAICAVFSPRQPAWRSWTHRSRCC